MKAWSAYIRDDGANGARNAVGAKLFDFTSARARLSHTRPGYGTRART
jgi:hypothetical protein